MLGMSLRIETTICRVWLAVAMCGAFAACVPSLNAVKSTASLGTQLASFESTFDAAATYCGFANLGSTPDPQCQQLQADAANWHAVNRALVGYAAALSAMADDSKDQNQQTTIATALGASAQIGKSWSNVLNANVTSGISQGVATLIAGITGGYRRERLATTIAASASAVAAVARGIDDNIALLDRAAQNLTATLGDTLTSIQLGSAPAADRLGLTFALASVKLELAGHRSALASYKAAVDAFAKAHASLRKGLHGLGERQADLELSRLIATDVVQNVQSTETALSPVAVPPTAPVTPAH
jgi:hypothetical protein